MEDETHYCYMIYTTDGSHTYVGATNDPVRRLRQHNKEIAGGAKATSIQCNRGLSWVLGCYITNIPEWRSALQIEWRWKQIGRVQFRQIKDPIERRLYALKKLLSLEKPTSHSIPYDSYPSGVPIIKWENEECKRIYDSIVIT
uniref:GIY-YIG domain-containing protein n=1 Tax=viral metagenome TaxID=1070528 RepID=A0A6C0KQF5_9ZZZZ